MTASSRSRLAFTLIELLVVVSIIIVLMGLLFPAFSSVQNQAKKTQAKNDLTQIVTAVNAFYTEYGKYPTTAATDAGAVYGGAASPSDVLFNELRAIAATLNTRQIVFVSPPDVKVASNPSSGIATANTNVNGIAVKKGEWVDAWGTPYRIALDADYDNTIAASIHGYADLTNPVRNGVIAWSFGKDQTQGNKAAKNTNFSGSDDVISWQ